MTADSGFVDDQTRLLTSRATETLDAALTPAFDQWTQALQRNTGAAVGAVCLNEGPRRLVKSLCTHAGSVRNVSELAITETLECHLTSLALRQHASGFCGIYAEDAVIVRGQIAGYVGMADADRIAWSESDMAALHDAAGAVATEMALRLAEDEAKRVEQLIASHNTVHDMIARAAPLRDVLIAVCEIIERYDPSLIPSILMLDPTSSTLHSGVGPSLPPEYVSAIDGVVIGPNIGTCGPAAWYGRLTITPDIATDPKWDPVRRLARAAGIAHCWSMPIKSPEGEVLGTLAFYGRAPRTPLPEHVALLHDWARVAGIAIERKRALDRLTHDARHDALTGLPNRLAIFEELDEAIQRARPSAVLAVLFLDLDGLKVLNDTLGHDRADEMIREIAGRLSDTSRDSDFVGRFGGDEFIVIADGLADPEEAGRLGARLLDAIAQPLPGLDSAVVTASIGIALVRSSAVDAREVIRDADAAMYEAKRSGRDRCVFSEVGHGTHAGRRLELARALRGAETRGELSLVFQPIVALPSMGIVGVEALLRWTSPVFGEVSPVEFIPIAEDTGSIIPIGAWVLRESCEAIASLAKLGHHLELDVNVSALQVSNPDFPLWVRNTIAHAGFPAHMLGLEITETALMRPNSMTSRNLRELGSLGVRIVIDDFGTGYSSLSWLKHHPFGAIKIDRSFVSGLPHDRGDLAIVAAVIAMARSLGCAATAEGVETQPQLAALHTLGCTRAQGFLLARPISVSLLTALLTETSQLTG